jgi:hypothetical protein
MRMRVDAVCLCALAVAGCSSSAVGPDAVTPPPAIDGASTDTPPPPPTGTTGVGAHTLVYYGLHTNDVASITTSAIATQPTGSVMIVSVGRGQIGAFARPTDNKSNGAYPQLGETHTYTHYADSGTALYALAGAAGGADFKISASTSPSDEVTLAAVEVTAATKVVDYQWNEIVQPDSPIPVTSNRVTTTGPATLIAFWWGDAPEPQNKTAVPNNGFTVIDSILKQGALVQCAVAVKDVPEAGSYDVTWDATPIQGAQLWLVAVQR